MIHKHFYYQFTDHVCCCKMLANLHKGGGGDGFSAIHRKITSVSQKILKTFSA